MDVDIKPEPEFIEDRCMTCKTTHLSGADKAAHLEGDPHKKRKVVHDFIANELADSAPDQESLLSIRYYRAGVSYVGGQFIVELEVLNQKDRLWACSACNVAGGSLYTVDSHIYSREHTYNSLQLIKEDEDGSSEYEKLQERLKSVSDSDILKVELHFILDCIAYYGPSVPIAYRYPISAEVLSKQLMITEVVKPPTYTEPIHDEHVVVHCNECFDTYISKTDSRSNLKNWDNHLSSTTHQEFVLFNSYYKDVPKEYVSGLPPSVSNNNTNGFKLNSLDLVSYGPLMGLKYLTLFASNSLCSLCCCVINNDQISQHFSCETHCQRYLRSLSPSSFVTSAFVSLNVLRKELNDVAIAFANNYGSEGYYKATVVLPSVFYSVSRSENRKLEGFEIKQVETSKGTISICEICKYCVKESGESSWETHIESEEHFDNVIEYQLIQRDERSFIQNPYDLPKFTRKKYAQWGDRTKFVDIQNYCEFAFDLIFLDFLSKKYICTCCYKEYGTDQKDMVVLHCRTLEHIKNAMCIINPNMAAILVNAKNGAELKFWIMDYLKHNQSLSLPQKIRTFDPISSFLLNKTAQIPRCLMKLAQNDYNNRNAFIKENKLTVTESGDIEIPEKEEYILLTLALLNTNLVLTKFDTKALVFWCYDCHLSFSVLHDDVKAIWTEHLLTELHWKRRLIMEQNSLPLMFLQDEYSKIQPTSVENENREAWIWNSTTSSYIFGLNNKLILDDVSHRELSNRLSNFFCSLCCDTFEITEIALTNHVRSLKHMIYYMHKYYSKEITEFEDIMAKNSADVIKCRNAIRSFIEDKLRSTEFKNSKILFYDCRDEVCQYSDVQAAVDKENQSSIIKKALEMTKINTLLSIDEISAANLHKININKIKSIKIKRSIFIHNVLNSLLDFTVKEKKHINEEEENEKSQKQSSQKHFIGPVISKVVISSDGKPIAIDVPAVDTKPVLPSLLSMPVPAPVPPPQNIVPIKIEPQEDMEVSDGEGEFSINRSRRRTRSRSISPPGYSRRYNELSRESPSLTRYRRSRSPIDRRYSEMLRERLREDRYDERRFREELSWRPMSPDDRRYDYDSRRRDMSPVRFNSSPTVEGRSFYDLRNTLENIPRNSSANTIDRNRPRDPPLGVDPKVFEKNLRHQIEPTPGVQLLPPINLSQPPPQLGSNVLPPMNMPPPNFMVPPVMPLPPTFGIPPPTFGPSSVGTQQPQQPQMPIMDATARIMHAKMELYQRDLEKINTKPELVSYLLTQGYDQIPDSDPVLYFNEVLKRRHGLVGGQHLCQICCYGQPDLETYFCLLCQYWTTAAEMFYHLKESVHRKNYLHKYYKTFHARVIILESEREQEKLLEEYCQKITRAEGIKLVMHRMRCVLNELAMYKIWPDIDKYVDNSWKILEDEEETKNIKTEVEIKKEPSSRIDREKEREKDRYRSRDRDRDKRDRSRRERSYSPSRSRDDKRRSRSPRDRRSDRDISSRSRDRDNDRDSRYKRERTSDRPSTPLWEKQTDIFSSTIEKLAEKPALGIDELDKQRNEKMLEQLRNTINNRNKPSNGSHGFDSDWSNAFKDNNQQEKESVKMTAAERRMIEQQTERKRREEFQRKVSALVLIRQEAVDSKGVDRDTVNKICKETNVDPADIFSDEVLEKAAETIGGDSIYELMAVAHGYKNPQQPTPKVLQEHLDRSGKQPHAATVLASLGIDKSQIANLLKKVSMAKIAKKNGTIEDEDSSLMNKQGNDSKKKKKRKPRDQIMKQKLIEMRNKMIAAGLDPGDLGIDDDDDVETNVAVPTNKPNYSDDRLPQQLPEDYQGPMGAKCVLRNARSRPITASSSRKTPYQEYSGFFNDDYSTHPSAYRLEQRGTPGSGANAVPLQMRTPGMPLTGPPSRPAQSHGFHDYQEDVNYEGYFSNSYPQERQFYTSDVPDSRPLNPQRNERIYQEPDVGDWDSAEQALSKLFG